jgi:hypothetical protein
MRARAEKAEAMVEKNTGKISEALCEEVERQKRRAEKAEAECAALRERLSEASELTAQWLHPTMATAGIQEQARAFLETLEDPDHG